MAVFSQFRIIILVDVFSTSLFTVDAFSYTGGRFLLVQHYQGGPFLRGLIFLVDVFSVDLFSVDHFTVDLFSVDVIS